MTVMFGKVLLCLLPNRKLNPDYSPSNLFGSKAKVENERRVPEYPQLYLLIFNAANNKFLV